MTINNRLFVLISVATIYGGGLNEINCNKQFCRFNVADLAERIPPDGPRSVVCLKDSCVLVTYWPSKASLSRLISWGFPLEKKTMDWFIRGFPGVINIVESRCDNTGYVAIYSRPRSESVLSYGSEMPFDKKIDSIRQNGPCLQEISRRKRK